MKSLIMLTVSDVAKRLQVSEEQVRRYIRQGDLRASKLGRGAKGKLRVSEEALQEFLSREYTR